MKGPISRGGQKGTPRSWALEAGEKTGSRPLLILKGGMDSRTAGLYGINHIRLPCSSHLFPLLWNPSELPRSGKKARREPSPHVSQNC